MSTSWPRAIISAVLLTMSVAQLSAQAADNDIRGLPLNWTDPKGTSGHHIAVLLSGDGGFADLATHVANGLADHGIGVVGVNSRAWLSNRRTPDETATMVARAIRAALARWHGDSVLIVGYSRGADMSSFIVNRLPPDLRSRVSAVAMFGLAPAASFEFHLIDLVKDTPRSTDVPVLPELLRLRGVPMACVYGSEEKTSGCRDAPKDLMHVEERTGGHHFDGDAKALVDVVLRLIGLSSSTPNTKL